MSAPSRRAGWLLTAVLVVVLLGAVALLLRVLGAGTAPAAEGAVDGTTPAVATARVETEALKLSALAAAREQVAAEAPDGLEVLDAGIISVTAEHATVLLFVDRPGTAPRRTVRERLVATLQRDGTGDGWSVVGVEPV